MNLNIGTIQNGFVVTRVRSFEELDATLVEMTHQRTGAQLAWLRRDDPNKLFSIGFKTVPQDDTGVFHILEHSVLCGSEKFTVKEPFVDLIKGSLNTFLNAMTFPDKTLYPVSSRNETDYMNLMEVYLDAVFAPALHHNPNIFRQEGWHYEVRTPEDTPIFKGVVFNEMKGAFSSVDRVVGSEMLKMLFPDTCYRFESGGDPKRIPELTYDMFTAAHKRFYHPSNALIYLDGDLPIEKTLALIDGDYLSHYDRLEMDFDVALQGETGAKKKEVEYEVAPGEDMKEKCQFAMGKVICSWEDKETTIALRVLFNAIASSNEAPLNKAILDKKLGQDVSIDVMDGIAQSCVLAVVRNTEKDRQEAIVAAIREAATKLVNEGIDKGELEASLNLLEFKNREHEEPQGLINNITALNSWLYGGDPALYLTQADTFNALRAKLGTGYFEKLLADALLDEAHMKQVMIVPSDTLGEKTRKEEEDRLKAARASWDESTLTRLINENKALDTWQQTPDTEKDKASLPVLRMSEVSEKPEDMPTQVHTVKGVQVLTRKSAANGITYVNLYFSVSDLPLEKLASANMAVKLMGSLPTRSHSALDLQREIKSRLGSLHVDVDIMTPYGSRTECKPMVVAHASVLDEKLEDAINLLIEVLTETDFTDESRIHDNLLQAEDGMRQSIIMGGHVASMHRVVSHESVGGAGTEYANGFEAYQWVKGMNKAFDEKKAGFIHDAQQLVATALTAARLTVSLTGACDDALVEKLICALPAGKKCAETATYPLTGHAKESIMIPAPITYAALGGNMQPFGGKYTGAFKVLTNILSFEYLWNAIRVQGGAYGCGFQAVHNGNIVYWSYRDPNGTHSLEAYKKSTEYLHSFLAQKPDLEKFMIGAISTTEQLMSAESKASTSDSLYLTGTTYDSRCRDRAELMHTTIDDLLSICPLLDKVHENASCCVIGNEAALEECKKQGYTIMEL